MNYREHEEPLLGSKMDLGITDVESGVLRFPQAIAHRGFKAQFPENTLTAFEGAVKAGAHAIETDLHLSKDGVVMISHDATLKRCFGAEGKLIDYDYSYLKTLRTLEAPHVPMPTLKEVLEFMCQPAVLDMWLLLDIKIDNDAEEIIRQTASAIHSVNPSREFWANRIVLGCWTLNFLPLCDYYLPGFPIAHIGLSIPYAREFLKHPGVSFNLFYAILSGKKGAKFLNDARAAGRDIYAWTVNDEKTMRWAIRNEIDAICTDDPVKFLGVCDGYPDGCFTGEMALRKTLQILILQFFAWLISIGFRCRYGFKLKEKRIEIGPSP